MSLWKTTMLMAGWLTAAAAAQTETGFYAQTVVAETNVFLGQVFNLDVIVKAAEKPDAPDIGRVYDFNITPLGDGQETSETNTWLYRFALRARREGDLQLPALHFGPLYTEPVEIKARKPELTDRMKLGLELSKTSVYLGEPMLLTATWDSTYQFSAIKSVDFHFPVLSDNRFQVLDVYEPDKETQTQTTGLPVHGTRVLATRNSYTAGEVQHQSLSFSKLLIPKKSGLITLQPATLLCAADKEKDNANRQAMRSAFQYPSYFDNTFFDQNVTGDGWARIYTESQPLELEVKPLPTDGRPALFNGMVGDYSIAVSAEPLDLQVGDPITLTITITASNYMENIFFEPLRYQPLLLNRFEIPSDRSLPKREGKSKIYTQTIRPLSGSCTEIPPIQLAYFSPGSKRYITVQSDPIPIRVSPAEQIGVYGGSLQQTRLRAVEEGIRHNHEGPELIQSRRPPLFGAPLFLVLALLFIPPLAVCGISLVSLFGEKRHHIHRTAKAARAYKVFRKNAAHITLSHSMKSDIYCDLDQVLRAYLGDRLHLNPGALTFKDAEEQMLTAGAGRESLDQLRNLFMLCEAYRFTQGFDEETNAKPIVHDAIRVIKDVEKSLR